MSEMRWQRSSACRRFEAARQSMGFLFRRLVVIVALERQSQGGRSMRSVRDSFPASDARFSSCLGFAHPVYIVLILLGLWAELSEAPPAVGK